MKSMTDCGTIGVLMGGCSSEKDISLKSGKAILEALRSVSCQAVPVELKSNTEDEVLSKIDEHHIDIAFIALHGEFGEDGALQEILEKRGISYTGSDPHASRLAINKVSTYNLVKQGHIAVPPFKALTRREYEEEGSSAEKQLDIDFPVVVKPAREGSSFGISIVKAKDQLPEAMQEAFRYDDKIIIEEYISGREITVGILGEDALPVIEIRPRHQFFNFEAKYEKGKTEYVVPAPMNEGMTAQVQEIALTAHHLLGCRDFSRVDFILEEKRPVFLEINTIPGFTQTSLLPMAAKARGIEFPELCLKIAQMALQRKEKTSDIIH